MLAGCCQDGVPSLRHDRAIVNSLRTRVNARRTRDQGVNLFVTCGDGEYKVSRTRNNYMQHGARLSRVAFSPFLSSPFSFFSSLSLFLVLQCIRANDIVRLKLAVKIARERRRLTLYRAALLRENSGSAITNM